MNTINLIFAMLLCMLVNAETNFEIITLSEAGDYIGGGQSWNLSTKTKCKISASWPREDSVGFSVECFNFMTAVSFQFASE